MARSTDQLATPVDHVVQFYAHDDELTETVGRYLADALASGGTAIVVANASHRQAFEDRVASAGIDTDKAKFSASLVMLDAADALERFVVDDRPDPAAFDAVIGELVREAAASGRPVHIYGEMVAELWDAGHVTAAIELEQLWNDLAVTAPFSLFCAYAVDSMTAAGDTDAFHEICGLHSSVIGGSPFDAARTFDALLESPRAARYFVCDALRRWGYDRVRGDAAAIVAELAANAVLHGRSPFTVAVSARADRLRLSVRDASTALPTLREAAVGMSGRGLQLVGATSDRWGTDLLADGKVVWAELRL